MYQIQLNKSPSICSNLHNLATMSSLTPQESLRYQRHFSLPEVGTEGQEKLKAASVLCIGTGGLGSPIALYLAAAGVGQIGLLDDDKVLHASFSPDGTKLIFRSSRPKTAAEIKEYQDLLKEGLVQPTEMELYICNADGSDLRQLTDLGNANWSPFFHPSGKKILFSSNFEAEKGFPFNLYLIDLDGKNLERITHGETFDAFPVFSNDGKKLVFSSNRNNGGGRDTNLFIAEWQD